MILLEHILVWTAIVVILVDSKSLASFREEKLQDVSLNTLERTSTNRNGFHTDDDLNDASPTDELQKFSMSVKEKEEIVERRQRGVLYNCTEDEPADKRKIRGVECFNDTLPTDRLRNFEGEREGTKLTSKSFQHRKRNEGSERQHEKRLKAVENTISNDEGSVNVRVAPRMLIKEGSDHGREVKDKQNDDATSSQNIVFDGSDDNDQKQHEKILNSMESTNSDYEGRVNVRVAPKMITKVKNDFERKFDNDRDDDAISNGNSRNIVFNGSDDNASPTNNKDQRQHEKRLINIESINSDFEGRVDARVAPRMVVKKKSDLGKEFVDKPNTDAISNDSSKNIVFDGADDNARPTNNKDQRQHEKRLKAVESTNSDNDANVNSRVAPKMVVKKDSDFGTVNDNGDAKKADLSSNIVFDGSEINGELKISEQIQSRSNEEFPTSKLIIKNFVDDRKMKIKNNRYESEENRTPQKTEENLKHPFISTNPKEVTLLAKRPDDENVENSTREPCYDQVLSAHFIYYPKAFDCKIPALHSYKSFPIQSDVGDSGKDNATKKLTRRERCMLFGVC